MIAPFDQFDLTELGRALKIDAAAKRAGAQAHFIMPAGFQSSRGIAHYAEVFRLADQARLLSRPDLAERRMAVLLALHGIEQG